MKANRRWRLHTRTANADYFWIDERLHPSRPPVATEDNPAPECVEAPPLHADVVDESEWCCGYLLADGRRTALLVNRLDAGRTDRFGRSIQHTLYLETDADDSPGDTAIRRLFIEALQTPPTAATAAGELARSLYDAWERKKDTALSAPVDWLSVLPPPLRNTESALISSSPIPPGGTFRRDENTVAQLTRLARTPTPGLVVIAALKPPEAIRTAANRLPVRPSGGAITVCSLRGESRVASPVRSAKQRRYLWLIVGLALLLLGGCLLYGSNRRGPAPENNAETAPRPSPSIAP